MEVWAFANILGTSVLGEKSTIRGGIMRNSATIKDMWSRAMGKEVTHCHGVLIFIRCRECGEIVEILTKIHVERHGMTKKEYIDNYPEHKDKCFWGTI